VILLVGAGLAHADKVTLPRTKAVLDVPASWTKIEAPTLVASYRGPSGHVLAVTRAQVPNPDAWRPKTRDAYADQIERGAVAASPGSKRTARKFGDVNGVPALDLELATKTGAIVMRVLLFRTYALTAAIEVPKGASLDDARAITAKFAPPKS
jgi:hypothetical protein